MGYIGGTVHDACHTFTSEKCGKLSFALFLVESSEERRVGFRLLFLFCRCRDPREKRERLRWKKERITVERVK